MTIKNKTFNMLGDEAVAVAIDLRIQLDGTVTVSIGGGTKLDDGQVVNLPQATGKLHVDHQAVRRLLALAVVELRIAAGLDDAKSEFLTSGMTPGGAPDLRAVPDAKPEDIAMAADTIRKMMPAEPAEAAAS